MNKTSKRFKIPIEDVDNFWKEIQQTVNILQKICNIKQFSVNTFYTNEEIMLMDIKLFLQICNNFMSLIKNSCMNFETENDFYLFSSVNYINFNKLKEKYQKFLLEFVHRNISLMSH